MATDKRLDQVSTLTDFDYALIVKGDQVAKASKQQLAELVGNLLYGATNASSLATVVAGLIGFDNVAIPKGRLEQQSFFSNSLKFRQNGIYLFNANSITDGSSPITSSSLWVIENKELYGNSDYLVQSLYSVGQSVCYIRFVTDSSFGSWQRIDNFGYNTLEELASGVAETLKITSTAPKRYNLSKSPRGVKLINATNAWVNYTAKVVGGCNGSVFEFSISALRSASSLTVTVVKTGTFNSSSYGLFKDDTGVYFVCKNTSGVNDDFLINSSQPIEGPKDIDTSSMTEITPS